MNAITHTTLSAALLLGCLAPPAQNTIYASTLTQDVDLVAADSTPLVANGSSLTITVGPCRLTLVPTVAFSQTMLVVVSPGSAELTQRRCNALDTLRFQPGATSPSTVEMHPQVKFGFLAALESSFGNGSGALPVATYQINSSPQPFDCYGFTPSTLSDRESHQLAEINLLDFIPGVDITGWIAEFKIDLNLDATVQQTVQTRAIRSSAGNAFQSGQAIAIPSTSPSLGPCSLSLSDVQAEWTDSVTVGEGLSVSATASFAFDIVNISIGEAHTDALLTETAVTSVFSSPFDLAFIFPPHQVTINQVPNGTVSPNTAQTVCQGDCLQLTAAPSPGYVTSGWVVNGRTFQTPTIYGNTFTLPDVSSDLTVSAVFSPWSDPYFAFPYVWTMANTNTQILYPINPTNPCPQCLMLAGIVNPGGFPGQAWFQWGTTAAYDNLTPPVTLGPVTTNIAVTNLLEGLLPNTAYHYMLVFTNGDVCLDGGDQTFTTPAVSPTASTGVVSVVSATAVFLNGSVNPEGSPVTVWFNWGTTTNYGNATPSPPFFLCGDTDGDAVAVVLTNILPATAYHYQLIASNYLGVASTPDQVFTTPGGAPTESDVLVTNIMADSAVVYASINPNGLDAAAWVNWGTAPSYGNTAPNPVVVCGNGNTNIGLAVLLSPLVTNTVYHLQLVASNAVGVTVGPDMVFTSSSNVPPPLLFQPLFAAGVGLQFHLAGYYPQTYTVQTCTNLLPPANWATLAELFLTNNIQPFVDRSATNRASQRFYRVLVGPPR